MDQRPAGAGHAGSHRRGAHVWEPPAADLLRLQAEAALPGRAAKGPRSVILFWLSGGPSHIDMWDPKPDAPKEARGPFGSIATAVPGVRFCEHLPRQAAIMDRLT